MKLFTICIFQTWIHLSESQLIIFLFVWLAVLAALRSKNNARSGVTYVVFKRNSFPFQGNFSFIPTSKKPFILLFYRTNIHSLIHSSIYSIPSWVVPLYQIDCLKSDRALSPGLYYSLSNTCESVPSFSSFTPLFSGLNLQLNTVESLPPQYRIVQLV